MKIYIWKISETEEQIIYRLQAKNLTKTEETKLKKSLNNWVLVGEGMGKTNMLQFDGIFKNKEDFKKFYISQLPFSFVEIVGSKDLVRNKKLANKKAVSKKSKKINLNRATLEQLRDLQGIGEKKAKEIIKLREQKKIETLDVLTTIRGISEKTIAKFEKKVCV